MPRTSSSCATEPNRPCSARYRTIRRAMEGPIPGSVSNSASSAWLTSIRAGAPEPASDPVMPASGASLSGASGGPEREEVPCAAHARPTTSRRASAR
jgi:hypothetical protein